LNEILEIEGYFEELISKHKYKLSIPYDGTWVAYLQDRRYKLLAWSGNEFSGEGQVSFLQALIELKKRYEETKNKK